MNSEDTGQFTITYRFGLPDGSTLEHAVTVDEKSLLSPCDVGATPPDWTRLDRGKCQECSYSGGEYCPIALRLVAPLGLVKTLLSYTEVEAMVITQERTYAKHTDAQDALRSLFGLIMATSGCPSMSPFRLMARHHLPFSTLEETIVRVVSSYFIQQYCRGSDPHAIQVDLKELDRLYQRMVGVTTGMVGRIRHAVEADGAVNAMVIFSSFSQLIPIVIEEEVDKLRALFAEY